MGSGRPNSRRRKANYSITIRYNLWTSSIGPTGLLTFEALDYSQSGPIDFQSQDGNVLLSPFTPPLSSRSRYDLVALDNLRRPPMAAAVSSPPPPPLSPIAATAITPRRLRVRPSLAKLLAPATTVHVTVDQDTVFVIPAPSTDEEPADTLVRGTVHLHLLKRKAILRVRVSLAGVCDAFGGPAFPYETTQTLSKQLHLDFDREVFEAGDHALVVLYSYSSDITETCAQIRLFVHDSGINGSLSALWVRPRSPLLSVSSQLSVSVHPR